MSWAIGYDSRWNRDIGYGVPATCDHPRCGREIDRGLAYVCCDEEPRGGERGCGLYFCAEHRDHDGRCARCRNRKPPYAPKSDTPRWVLHKLSDPTWAVWRDCNPEEVLKMAGAIRC